MIVNRVGRYLSSKYCHEIASKNGQMHWKLSRPKWHTCKNTRTHETTTKKKQFEKHKKHIYKQMHSCTYLWKNTHTHSNRNNQVYFALQMWIATERIFTQMTREKEKKILARAHTKKRYYKLRKNTVKCKWVYRNKSYHHK